MRMKHCLEWRNECLAQRILYSENGLQWPVTPYRLTRHTHGAANTPPTLPHLRTLRPVQFPFIPDTKLALLFPSPWQFTSWITGNLSSSLNPRPQIPTGSMGERGHRKTTLLHRLGKSNALALLAFTTFELHLFIFFLEKPVEVRISPYCWLSNNSVMCVNHPLQQKTTKLVEKKQCLR